MRFNNLSPALRPWFVSLGFALYLFAGLPLPAFGQQPSYSIGNGSATPRSVAPGQTLAIKADFSLTRAGTMATYFEIRNSSNAIVGHQSYNNQNFAAGQVRSYTWNFTVPSNWPAGTYRVHAGIFAADWSRTLHWVNDATSFGVAAVPTYAISNGSVTPSSITPGQSVAIKADFRLGQAETVATYLEIRNASNAIVGHQSYNSQVFSAGQTRSYTWAFTVPSNWPAGTYRVHAGIFASDWSRKLYWVNDATSFGVTAAPTYTISNGSVTPSSTTAGQTVAIKADFRLGQAETVATYFEIRDASNAIIGTQSYNSQVFSAGQTRTYTWTFTVPSNWPAGTYRVNGGIFTADWSKNVHWAPEAAGFGVTAAPTYSISNESATPSSLAPGQTVVVAADFTVAQAETVATYFEIRDSGSAIVGTQSYNSQAFSAGQTRPYTWHFTVPSDWPAGTYKVHAGIFTADWSKNLHWTGTSSFTVTPAQTGRQFYVDSVSGSDSNSGTSSSAPWQSLAKVNGATFQPGDVINFRRGSLWTGTLQVRSTGTSDSPVTYRAYGSGTAPQIRNPGVSYGEAINVAGDWNVVQDFLLTDAHEAGVDIAASANYNMVYNNEITRTGTGVMTRGEHNLITGNYVHDLTMVVNNVTPNWDDYGAVCFWFYAGNNELSYNRGVNCRAPSYDFGNDGGFTEIFSEGNNVDNLYIHHNYAENTNGFFELGASNNGSAQNIRVAYNVIVNVTAWGSGTSVCFNLGNFSINVSAFRFEHNTFVSTSGHPDAYRVFGCRSDLTFLEVRNNIFRSDIQIANNGNFTHTDNLYHMVNMVSGSGVGFGLGPGEYTRDPLFVDLGAGNFRLQPLSFAIDRGMHLGYEKDFEGTAVPQGLAPDVGAFELKVLR